MENLRLIVPKSQDPRDWFSFLKQHLDQSFNVENLTIDFNSISFLGTDDFVLLACLIECYTNKENITFIGGTTKFNKHLEQIKFKHYWKKDFDRREPTLSNDRSIMCLWKISHERINAYSEDAKRYFKSITDNGELDLGDFANIIVEVLNNIFDHSESKNTGYIITRFHKDKNLLSFSVCDFGIGIPNSINRHLKENNKTTISDGSAIEQAIANGYTAQSTPRNRGMGLFNIKELVDDSLGQLTIYSNNGILVRTFYKNEIIQASGFNFSGTLVRVDVDLSTFEEIDEDEAFFDF